MGNGTYAQINYNLDDPEDVTVTEVNEVSEVIEAEDPVSKPSKHTEESMFQASEYEEEPVFETSNETQKLIAEEPGCTEESGGTEERGDTAELAFETPMKNEAPESEETEHLKTEESSFSAPEPVQPSEQETSEEQETAAQESAEEVECGPKEKETFPGTNQEPVSEEKTETHQEAPLSPELASEVQEEIESIHRTLRRLEKKFDAEILNGDNRDSSVKTIYKELNEYKAGLVEKALKNVLYDIVDLRETMLSQIKFLREKKGLDAISLDEFSTYADDIGDILEKHDVLIYKGEPGEENVAVRQKIVRKVETEDETQIKKVAESLSYGYEYNSKILYPEKISIYVKKK